MRWRARVPRLARDDAELHHLACRVGVCAREIDTRLAAAEGFVRPDVPQQYFGSRREAGEVDDDVGALGGPQQKPRRLDGCGQKAAIRSDLPEAMIRFAELEDQETRVATIEQAQTIAPRLDFQVRPRAAIDDQRIAEEFRIPDRRDVAPWNVRSGKAVEEFATVRIEQRTIDVERPILDDDGNLVVAHRWWIARRRRRSRQTAAHRVPGPAAQQGETGRPCVDVEP